MKKIFAALALSMISIPAHANEINDATVIKSGYVWKDSGEGKITIRVNISKQMVYVYRNDKLVAASRASTGRAGKETPTGKFPITFKKEKHVSSIYGSPMPFTQRLTSDGIALHAGNVSVDKASAGCVRLPYEFAQKLFAVTKIGDVVVIEDTTQFDLAFSNFRS